VTSLRSVRGRGAAGDLHHDVRGLHDADHGHPRPERELLSGLGRHQADEPELTRLHLDNRGDAIAFDLRDDPGKTVAGGLGDDRTLALPLSALGLKSSHLRQRDEPLAALRATYAQLARGLPAAKRIDGDPEDLRGFTDADGSMLRFFGALRHEFLGIARRTGANYPPYVLRLASSSPRRIQLLRLLQVPFEVTPPDVDEQRFVSPARAKADALARSGEITLAADTQIDLDGERVGKPRDESHAIAMLATLAGREHEVRTEIAIVDAAGRRRQFAVRSRVTLRELSLRQIERYVGTGEPLDKAGAYAIQGEGRSVVASLDGCLANITGLPLCHVYFALRRAGVAPRERPEVACQAHFDFVCPVWRAAQRQGRALRDGGEYRSWSEDVSGLQ
jgi:septum formation protein